MIAKKDYFLDKNGEITTDEAKAESLICRKDSFIQPHTANKFGLVDGEIVTKSEPAKENKSLKPAKENK